MPAGPLDACLHASQTRAPTGLQCTMCTPPHLTDLPAERAATHAVCPAGTPNPILDAALRSGGEYVDTVEARKAAASAEYAQMLRDAQAQAAADGAALPDCATRKLGDAAALGGCAGDTTLGDLEFQRTRGLDSNRAWIDGPPPATPVL